MAEQTILIAEDDPDIRDGVLDDVTNLISTAASLASYLLKIGANSTTGRGQLGAGLPEQRRKLCLLCQR